MFVYATTKTAKPLLEVVIKCWNKRDNTFPLKCVAFILFKGCKKAKNQFFTQETK